MRVQPSLVLTLALVSCAYAEDEEQPWAIHGQVVDENGKPVDDYTASTFWLANGNWWDEKGELFEEAKKGKLWTNEGVLVASPKALIEKTAGGGFNLTVDGGPRQAIYAMDKLHERGGIALVEQSAAPKSVTIKLAPLVRVTGKVYCSEAGKVPEWTDARVFVPDDKGHQTKIAICGSFRGQFSFLLPPGNYDFDAHSQSPSAGLPEPEKDGTAVSRPRPFIRVEVPADQPTLDLGTIDIVLPRDKEGIPRDLTQYYGKVPPELTITDARGVPKTVKLSDFRGKWVLLDFWEVGCYPCVKESLPELAKFYEEHAADRKRFEILAICNTDSDKALTIDQYDKLAAPLVKDMWDGKQLPFPVLVDGEGKTFGVYGIRGVPNVLLIDPEGRLVKDGDEKMLAEKLKAKK